MGFGRHFLRVARLLAWAAGIFAAIVGVLAWLYPISQSKEPNQPPPFPAQLR